MRPLRGLLACLGTLVLVTVVLTLRRSSHKYDDSGSASSARNRFRAFFSFHTPEALFPPSAIISLTDDNSTFFLARPAAFGTSLPSDGLSGQLWVGSGFVDEARGRGGSIINSQGELGCSDIPGWPYTGDIAVGSGDDADTTKVGAGRNGRTPRSKREQNNDKSQPPSEASSLRTDKPVSQPPSSDGTDDYLHWPLKPAPFNRGLRTSQESDDGGEGKDNGHADIQSIQETAEIAGKVVLLSRGGCGFLEKTKWVQRRGGVALIVGDNTRGAALVTMYANGDTSNITIPSIFTSHMSAQLLSSLSPPGDSVNGRPASGGGLTAGPFKSGRKYGSKATKEHDQESPLRTTTTTTTTNKPAIAPGSSNDHSWARKLRGLFGSSHKDDTLDSRRFPSSGRINRDNEVKRKSSQSKSGQDGKQQGDKSDSNAAHKDENLKSGGFVIGVHDWRDPDLVELQREAPHGTQTTAKTTSTSIVSNTMATGKASGDSKGKGFPGSNAVPGSGRYFIPGQELNQVKSDKAGTGENAHEKNKWLDKLFSNEVEELTEEEAIGFDDLREDISALRLEIPATPPLAGIPGPREGLWVTITPTNMSTSPFFDTLLVLVVSPLVTLTVVYALLLLRARIQRRRWRAPKSVVERLPVRVYHTMSTTSTSSSSQTPSVESSSSTSPLLQTETTATLTRTRPRSRTLTSVDTSPAMTLEQQREDLVHRYEKKRYRGRQVECAVCLEEYIDGQSQVMSLPCGHEFHAECITPWLTTRRRTCPICKGDVVRSLAAASMEARSASPSPSRRSGPPSRARSLDRRGSPHSDTPLLGRRDDDLERGSRRRTRPADATFGWAWVTNGVSRMFGERSQREPDMADRNR